MEFVLIFFQTDLSFQEKEKYIHVSRWFNQVNYKIPEIKHIYYKYTERMLVQDLFSLFTARSERNRAWRWALGP